MLKVKGYLVNNASPLDGGTFLVQHKTLWEFVNWLKGEISNSVVVVLVSIEEE